MKSALYEYKFFCYATHNSIKDIFVSFNDYATLVLYPFWTMFLANNYLFIKYIH
jgi:hypothetical protein